MSGTREGSEVPCAVTSTPVVENLSTCPAVIAVILYGSVARGEATPLSDIDICVVSVPSLDRKTRDWVMSYASRSLDIRLFHDLPPAIQHRVMGEGVTLFCRDESVLTNIWSRALRVYLDFQPTLNRYCKEAIAGRRTHAIPR
jgi:predicted nucleotidyltransferase